MYPLVLKSHERPVTVIRFNYDGDLLFSGCSGSKVNLWDSYTGERIGSYQSKSAVKSLDVDILSQYLVTCGFDGTLQIFDVKTGKETMNVNLKRKLKQVEFNYGSSSILILQDEYVPNLPSLISVYEFGSLLEQPRGEKLSVQSDKITESTSFKTCIEENNNLQINKISTRVLWYVDNKSFFAATNDGFIIHYDYQGKVIKKLWVHENNTINSMAFSANFSILATAADNGSKILDPETLEVIRYFKQQLPMNCISISPLFCVQKNPKFHLIMGGGIPAMMAASCGGDAGFDAHLCNVMYGNQIGKIGGHFGPINSIQFFRDGRGYASGGQQGIVRVIRFNEAYFDHSNKQFE